MSLDTDATYGQWAPTASRVPRSPEGSTPAATPRASTLAWRTCSRGALLEGRAKEFQHAGLDLPGPGDVFPGVVVAAVGLPACRPLVTPGPDEPGRFLVEQRIERLLDGLPHQILYVLALRFLVD